MPEPDAADVLVGPWPEPGEDGALPADQRRTVRVRLLERHDDRQVVEIDGIRHVVGTVVDIRGEAVTVHTVSAAGAISWNLEPRFAVPEAGPRGAGPASPLPGVVIRVAVAAGQRVGAGDLLVVVEAMKTEHRITADAPAVVTDVLVDVGDRVDTGDMLVVLEADV